MQIEKFLLKNQAAISIVIFQDIFHRKGDLLSEEK